MMEMKRVFRLNRGLAKINDRRIVMDDYERAIINSSDSWEKIAILGLPLPVLPVRTIIRENY